MFRKNGNPLAIKEASSARKKCIGVIGAGVSGLAAANAFRRQGHDVVVFERSDDVGGVWHPERSYPGIRTQSPRSLYRYTDLDYPDDCPEWPSGGDVRRYLQRYAKTHDLMRLVRFGSTVVSMKEVEERDGWALTVHSSASYSYTMEFDFVAVCTGTFTDKRTVHHPGQGGFVDKGGAVLHSSEYKDLTDDDVKGKDVVIIGGSKSATDIAVHVSNRGARNVTMIMRRNMWRVPQFIGGLFNSKYALFPRAQEMQFPSWKRGASPLAILFRYLAMPFIWANFRMLEIVLSVQLGLRKGGMMPSERIEDSVSCEIPNVTEGFMELVRDGVVRPVVATIERYQANSRLSLNNGESVRADIVIQATGWTMNLPFLPKTAKDKLIDETDGLFRLYRFAVNPAVPHIGFVGFNSSFCSVLSSDLVAHWLVRFADERLTSQPTSVQMEDDIDHMLQWKRKVYPPARVYAGLCVAPFHHLHFEELLTDMGATVKNKSVLTHPDPDFYRKCLESTPKYQLVCNTNSKEEEKKKDEKYWVITG